METTTREQKLGLGRGTRITSERIVRYFVICKTCKHKATIDYTYAETEQCWMGRTLTGTTVYRLDGSEFVKQQYDRLCKQCQSCKSWSVKTKQLRQVTVKTERQCDARCEMATSEKCECSCGGARHGIAYLSVGN